VTIELSYRSNNPDPSKESLNEQFLTLDLSRLVGLVTGASKGIGKVFAEVLASRGVNVVLVARSKDALTAYAENLSEKYGIRAVAIGADLASPRAQLIFRSNWRFKISRSIC